MTKNKVKTYAPGDMVKAKDTGKMYVVTRRQEDFYTITDVETTDTINPLIMTTEGEFLRQEFHPVATVSAARLDLFFQKLSNEEAKLAKALYLKEQK